MQIHRNQRTVDLNVKFYEEMVILTLFDRFANLFLMRKNRVQIYTECQLICVNRYFKIPYESIERLQNTRDFS